MIASLIVFAVVYILMVTERIDRVTGAILGAMTVILLRLIPYDEAIRRIDVNVLFLLIGMMIVVGILADTGMFEWLAVSIAQKSQGRGLVIVVGLLGLTAGLSAFLDNVTTVILTAPITILLAQILNLPTTRLLILQAIFSNIGGTATLIGDPPNILIGSKGGLSFNDFLVHTLPITVVVCASAMAVVVVLFWNHARIEPEAYERIREAEPARAILDAKRLRRAVPICLLILVAFVLSTWLGIEAGVVAMCGAFAMMVACDVDARTAMEKVEWDTVLFLLGLFMLVGALEHNGLFISLGHGILSLTGGNGAATALLILWVSGIGAALLGAVPVAMAMIPLILSITPLLGASSPTPLSPEMLRLTIEEPLLWALSLGACFGGNGMPLGTPASIIVLQIARRNRYEIHFSEYVKLGIPLTFLSLVLSSLYIYFHYF